MIRRFFVKLITNFQPRMNLGEKRFMEDQEAHKEASDYNKEIVMRHERERLKRQGERVEPSDNEILGPSDSKEA